jgi:hypothetical protein
MFRKACHFENADVALSGCGDTAEEFLWKRGEREFGEPGERGWGERGDVHSETRRPILSL